MKNTENTLITLITASLIHEVEIAKTLLANYGIESYVFDKNIDVIIGTAFVDGYKLKVSTLDYEKAKKILNEINTADNS